MHTLILGNGIAGVSAAMRLRELDPQRRITILSGESKYHYSRPALMYLFLGHMTYRDIKPYEDHVWAEQRLDLVRDWAIEVLTDKREVRLRSGGAIPYDDLLLATGSESNRFGWPGQDLPGVQGFYDLFDLRLLVENAASAKRAVIVGGGLIGIELAEMLLARGIQVTFLVREPSYWSNVLPAEESAIVNRLIQHHGVDLRLQTELAQILPGPDGRVMAVRTKGGEEIPCQLVGLTAGVRPNVALARAAGIPTGRGVLVDERLRSQVAGVWAAGDCAEIVASGGQKLLQQVWYTGRFQGRHAAESILGSTASYDSGIWFNSAKFFDLEYQTYGSVNRNVPGEASITWTDPSGERFVRIVHRDGKVIGFNLLGVRYRHRTLEAWIREAAPLDEVIPKLRQAAFDPEFTEDHTAAVSSTHLTSQTR